MREAGLGQPVRRAVRGGELRPLLLSLALADAHAPIGLGGLPALVDRARSCGLQVDLNLDPEPVPLPVPVPVPLPPQVDAAAYRIVQEALTNAARHAPGALVRIHITCTGEHLSVEVGNHAPTHHPAVVTAEGHGLRGMAERSAACGGTFVAGAQPDGGFGVRAQLPLEAPA